MLESLLLTLVGVAFLVACIRVLHQEADPTIRTWTLGWAAFVVATMIGRGLGPAEGATAHGSLFLAYTGSSAASLFFLLGVFTLVRFDPPRWVIPASALIIAARGFAGVLGDPVAAELLGTPVEVGSNLGAAWLVWRWTRHTGRPHDQLALVSAHLLLAFAEGFMTATWAQGWDRAPANLAMSAATVFLAGTQIVVVLRRSADRVDEANEDRERDLALLRDLAHLATRHAAGPPLLREASQTLRDGLRVDWVGIWRWSRSGGRWVESDAGGVPDDVRSAAARVALCVDDMDAQPGGGAPPGLDELTARCAGLEDAGRAWIPLEWQGEVLGVLGLGQEANRPLPANVRSALATLAGELALSLSHVLSIRQRDRANFDLLAARRKLAAVIETAPMGLLVTTADGRVELLNSAAAEHVGCGDPQRFVGGPMAEFVDDLLTRVTEPGALLENVRLATDAHGVMREVELDVLRPEPATLLLFSSRVYDDAGAVTAHIWASRDVTAERALGDQLRHAQKLETLGTLSGGIAHDFNNQLAVILGNARFARDTLEDESVGLVDVDEALSDLERAADHCAQLTRSLLSFARRAPVSLGFIVPNQIVRELGELLRPLLPSSIRLECEAEPDLPPILADGAQLQQVLVNLALNARDAIEEHGEIRIRAYRCDVGVEHVRRRGTGRPGPHLCLEVTDTGHGLEGETLERIFEPFYTTKPVGKGTGLGLAIVHGVVSAHGGWVEVESEVGEGTEFHIYLPLDHDEVPGVDAADETADRIALETVAAQPDRVLVADDHEAVRNLLVRGLEARGFAVTSAVDGEDAVKRFTEDTEGFTAVVLDWSMPGLPGSEAAAEIQRLDPRVPILVATGHGHVETDLDVEIVPKPFDLDDLARRIRNGAPKPG